MLSQAETTAAYDRADTLLAEAEASDMQAISEAEALEREASTSRRSQALQRRCHKS